MIITNKFSVEWNLEAVDRDFDIFLVTKPRDLYKANVLDLATQQFQARAVQFDTGGKALVLFGKNDISEQAFKSAVMTDYPDAKVEKLDILNEDVQKNNFYYQNRMLLQLIVNSLYVPTIEGFSYNNLTGKLYYGDPSWRRTDKKTKKPYSLYFLEISFDPGLYLNLKVKTFRKKKNDHSGRTYLPDPKSGNFRIKLNGDAVAPEDLFVAAGFDGSHNTVPYLDFGSFETFKKCRLGIMERFLQNVRREFGEYFTLTAERREGDICYSETKKEKENLSGVDYGQILNEMGVSIVDLCNTKESGLIVSRLVSELEQVYGVTAQAGKLQKSRYNIMLIHNAEYYEKMELPDPYAEKLKGYTVQHMTQEENEDLMQPFEEKSSPIIHKIVTELILKGDIHQGQIRIYNWEKLCAEKTWTFVRRDKLKNPGVEQFEKRENAAGRKISDRFRYVAVEINPAGNLRFFTFDDREPAANRTEEKIRFAFDTYVAKQKPKHKKVEGLVYSDIENIHAIIQTCEKTMPNISAVWNCLRETNVKGAVPRDVVLEALAVFGERFPEMETFAARVMAEVQASQGTLRKGDLKNFLNMRTKAGKLFNRFLHEEYSIWVSPEIKSSDFDEEYMLKNVMDIKYFEDNQTDGEKGVRSLNYYAGPPSRGNSSPKFSVKNASVIRQVQAQEEVEFKELLPLLAVDFVRIGQYTVLPFPFKYLREYMEFF